MARIKRGIMRHKRHKKVIKAASGYFQRKGNVYKNAIEQVMKSGQYAFRDRRSRKRDFRRQWIVRLSAACADCGIKYNELIHGLNTKGIQVNRKMLSELAIADFEAFKKLVETAVAK